MNSHPDGAPGPVSSALADQPFQPARSALHYRDLLRELVGRELKLRYRRSILGVAWSLLHPLAQLLVYLFVFRVLIPLDIPHYSAFVFIGVLAWNWFHGALMSSTGAVVNNRELIRQPGFPPAILPVAAVTSHSIHFLLALPVLFGFLLVEGIPLTAALVTLPLIVALQFALTLGFAYVLAALNVVFRDTQYLLEVALHLAFFLTPVFYDATSVPEDFASYLRFNPMTQFLETYRAVLLEGSFPQLGSLVFMAVIALALPLVGARFFRRASHGFVEEL